MLYEPTCDVCGHHIEDDRCDYCRNTGENGDWVKKIIEQAKDRRYYEKPSDAKREEKKRLRREAQKKKRK